MPDPTLIFEALALAAGIVAAAVLLTRWPWRKPAATRTAINALLGVLLGVYLGCWWLGLMPHWPPREDQDRFLLLLLPAVALIEIIGTLDDRLRWVLWLPRLLIAAGAARLLLHGSVYIAGGADPETGAWTPTETWLILGGSGTALAATWFLLSILVRRTQPQSVLLAAALACGAASITVMLSGYATGGQIGLPLAAALTGAALASLGLANPPLIQGLLSLGVIGLFGLVIIGRFFGQLTTPNAVLLFGAPLFCWTAGLAPHRKLGPRWQSVLRLCLTAAPAGLALLLALQKFESEPAPAAPSTGVPQPTIEDYMNFGK